MILSGVLGLVQEKLKKLRMKVESGGNSWILWYKYSSPERRTRMGSRSDQVNDTCVEALSPVFQSQCSYSRVCIFEIWDYRMEEGITGLCLISASLFFPLLIKVITRFMNQTVLRLHQGLVFQLRRYHRTTQSSSAEWQVQQQSSYRVCLV